MSRPLTKAEIKERADVVILAGIMKDRDGTEAYRAKHRAQHGGVSSDQCEFCGFLDAAVYRLQTGRSLSEDFLKVAEETPEAQP